MWVVPVPIGIYLYFPAGSCRHQQALFGLQIGVKRYLEVIEILRILYVPSSVHTYTDRGRKLLFLFLKGRLQLVLEILLYYTVHNVETIEILKSNKVRIL